MYPLENGETSVLGFKVRFWPTSICAGPLWDFSTGGNFDLGHWQNYYW